jgi:hypothetical protein
MTVNQPSIVLPLEICRQRFIRGHSASAPEFLSEEEVREVLEASLSQHRCPRCLRGIVAGLMEWACAAAAVPSQDLALIMLGLVPSGDLQRLVAA